MKLILNFGVALLMVFSVFACSSLGYQSPYYVKLAHQITARTAKKINTQKNLVLIGTGGGMMDDIQMMAMSFNFYQEVDLKTARELIVYAANEYLLAINSNKEIKPYLHDYPFTDKNIEIVICFHPPDGSTVAPGKINIAAARKGRVTYYIDYPEKYTIKPIFEETYEEALQKISSK